MLKKFNEFLSDNIREDDEKTIELKRLKVLLQKKTIVPMEHFEDGFFGEDLTIKYWDDSIKSNVETIRCDVTVETKDGVLPNFLSGIEIDGMLTITGGGEMTKFHNMPSKLQSLQCRGKHKLVSLEGITADIENLDIDYCANLHDLTYVPKDLKYMSISGTAVSDLSLLSECKNLRFIIGKSTRVESLYGLNLSEIMILDLEDSPIEKAFKQIGVNLKEEYKNLYDAGVFEYDYTLDEVIELAKHL